MANETYSPESEFHPEMLIRRGLFLMIVLGLALYHLFLDFRGLTEARGIDQAQIAREVARGNGFATKNIRPLSVHQVNRHRASKGEDPVRFTKFQDTFHAPLNPLLNSLFLKLFKGSEGSSKWEFDVGEESVYFLDRVIAAVSMMLFFAAIGITYLLVSRIFDTKIGGVTALLMLLCSLMWDFTQSGLPQMLMLFLLSFGLYFLYRAIETQQEGSPPFVWIALTAGFFGLLALTHWVAIWPFIGLFVFSAFYFRPRGIVALVLLFVFSLIIVAWGVRNYNVCGDFLGTGLYSLMVGLTSSDGATVFRNFDPEALPFVTDGFWSRLVVNSLDQVTRLYQYFGAIIVAPLFFLSLLHPFKRREIADFRWCILSMWVFAVIGMTFYGLPEGVKDPNQMHILFAPVMAAYGLAFLTVVWNRLGFETLNPLVTQGHLIIVCLLTALPLLATMPKNVRVGIQKDKRQFAVWPPYYPPAINQLNAWTDDNEIILSDAPWAVAWYADRSSIWIPRNQDQFAKLRQYASERRTPMAGVFLSPLSVDLKMVSEISNGSYSDWKRLIMAGEGVRLGYRILPPDFPFQSYTTMPFSDMSYFYSDSDRWAER